MGGSAHSKVSVWLSKQVTFVIYNFATKCDIPYKISPAQTGAISSSPNPESSQHLGTPDQRSHRVKDRDRDVEEYMSVIGRIDVGYGAGLSLPCLALVGMRRGVVGHFVIIVDRHTRVSNLVSSTFRSIVPIFPHSSSHMHQMCQNRVRTYNSICTHTPDYRRGSYLRSVCSNHPWEREHVSASLH